jgi:hypothetical protein
VRASLLWARQLVLVLAQLQVQVTRLWHSLERTKLRASAATSLALQVMKDAGANLQLNLPLGVLQGELVSMAVL